MLNPKLKLNPKIFNEDCEQVPIRKGFGQGLVLSGEADANVVALCADLTESTQMNLFAEKFPERFIEVGVAEQNLVTIASGMAAMGKIPFCSSYAMFSPGRNWEQIRTTIAYNDRPVKIVGSHAGISVGPDGGTHQALEDIALMRVMPNMEVLSPCDAVEAKKATLALAQGGQTDKPAYATGSLVHRALFAAKELEIEGIKTKVLNLASIKPIDINAIVALAKECKAIVTVEEHQVAGGMGSAVAEVLAQNYPVPIEFIGVQNKFGQSGTPDELVEHYGMGKEAIKEAVKKVLKRKV
ncbi:MAG: hypothetical protein UU30_C0003G0006 [Candidatus Nomurabacteria bacterium GW2011_GWA2_40_97]|nr:MAG: hypothetical protein UU30_C0003G0006 [Candidatus Nomurabacteria bacterium GW2011_GWA2_40_97]